MDNTFIFSSLQGSLFQDFSGIYEKAMVYADDLTLASQIVCGLLALGYVGSRLYKSWARGEQIDFYAQLRPFAIGLLICFFSVFASFLDVIVSPLSQATTYIAALPQEETISLQTTYYQLNEQMRDKQSLLEREIVEKNDVSELYDAEKADSIAFSESDFMAFLRQFSSTFAHVAQIAVIVMVFFLQTFVLTAKVVLTLIGPFAFALSLMAGFEGNIQNWITRYVHVLLIIPICNIIGFVQAMLCNLCLYTPQITSANHLLSSSDAVDVYQAYQDWLLASDLTFTVLSLAAVIMYAKAFTMSSWILRSDSLGSLFSKK